MSYANGPQIVTDGLIVYLDAGNIKSYPNSGTIWKDLSGNGFDAESDAPAFLPAESLGAFDMDPLLFEPFTMTRGGGTVSILNTQTPSVEVWIKTDNTNQNGFFFEKGRLNSQYSLFQEGTNIQWRQNIGGSTTTLSATTATYISTTRWAHIVGTYTSGTRRLYINGAIVNSDSQTGTINTSSVGFSVGVDDGNSDPDPIYKYDGKMAILRVYNKALSPNEVLQNYNASKTRFGL